jgi:hypothetical protein
MVSPAVATRLTPSHASRAKLVLRGNGDVLEEASDLTFDTLTGGWHLYGPGLQGWPVRVFGICKLDNETKGNGQFPFLLHQLIAYCTEQQLDLVGMDVNNERLAVLLINRWGFQRLPNSSHLVRRCYSATTGSSASQ